MHKAVSEVCCDCVQYRGEEVVKTKVKGGAGFEY
jgi:hypothetical protein